MSEDKRKAVVDAIVGLPEAEFDHVVVVCHDIARRLGDNDAYAELGRATRGHLGIPEPPAAEVESPEQPGAQPGDVTVELSGVAAKSEVGGF